MNIETPSRDPIGKRVDRITDTIYGLYAGGHMRRKFTNAEAKRLIVALRQFDEMLRIEGILL